MGGKGSGRLSTEDELIRSGRVQQQTPIMPGMFIPNLSGDHSAGLLLKTPTKDTDLVNKKYVDDHAGGITGSWGDLKLSGSGTNKQYQGYADIYGGLKCLSGSDVKIRIPGICPTGTVILFAYNGGPQTDGGDTEWLVCDGTLYNFTRQYFNLYSVIGDTFGTSGSEWFAVPNIIDVYVKGAKTNLGTTGGSTDYTPTGSIDAHGRDTVRGSTASPIGPFTSPDVHTFTGDPATIEPPYIKMMYMIKT